MGKSYKPCHGRQSTPYPTNLSREQFFQQRASSRVARESTAPTERTSVTKSTSMHQMDVLSTSSFKVARTQGLSNKEISQMRANSCNAGHYTLQPTHQPSATVGPPMRPTAIHRYRIIWKRQARLAQFREFQRQQSAQLASESMDGLALNNAEAQQPIILKFKGLLEPYVAAQPKRFTLKLKCMLEPYVAPKPEGITVKTEGLSEPYAGPRPEHLTLRNKGDSEPYVAPITLKFKGLLEPYVAPITLKVKGFSEPYRPDNVIPKLTRLSLYLSPSGPEDTEPFPRYDSAMPEALSPTAAEKAFWSGSRPKNMEDVVQSDKRRIKIEEDVVQSVEPHVKIEDEE